MGPSLLRSTAKFVVDRLSTSAPLHRIMGSNNWGMYNRYVRKKSDRSVYQQDLGDGLKPQEEARSL